MPVTREIPCQTYLDGVLVEEWVEVVEISDEQDREERMRDRLAQALLVNRQYVVAPVAATAAARIVALEEQVRLLSRQNNALIRIVNQLMDGDD